MIISGVHFTAKGFVSNKWSIRTVNLLKSILQTFFHDKQCCILSGVDKVIDQLLFDQLRKENFEETLDAHIVKDFDIDVTTRRLLKKAFNLKLVYCAFSDFCSENRCGNGWYEIQYRLSVKAANG